MTLEAGDALGGYEILGSLGAGGMGEVYRARDSKLGREVAIKVLPQEFAGDEERLARFEREARALALLNHPNIATLHGSEHDGGVHFLVMELVEGVDLSHRLREGGPLSLAQARPLFVQLARALEAAHGKGVVHRDLKPGNLMVTDAGELKVLDFGLAKALAPEGTPEGVSRSPTLTALATRFGDVLGTAPYMSPEQARGQEVDQRTDVWAFGCVLFEAVTGRPPFAGQNVADVLASVTRDEPPWERLPKGAPRSLHRLLELCLAKEPARRLRAIEHARLELEQMPEEQPQPDAQPRGRLSHLSWPTVAAGLALVIVAIAYAGRPVTEPESPPRPVRRFSVRVPVESEGQLDMAYSRVLTISPDGTQIAYAAGLATPDLYLRPLDRLQPRLVAASGTSSGSSRVGYNLAFSPDGTRLLAQNLGQWIRIDLAGGPTVSLTESRTRGAFWHSDDFVYLFGPGGVLERVPAGGGDEETLLELGALTPLRDDSPDGLLDWPHLLPDGRTLLFTARTSSGRWDAWAADLQTRRVRRLAENASSPTATSKGHVIFFRAERDPDSPSGRGALWAAPFDVASLSLAAEPVLIEPGVRGSNAGTGQYSLARDGTLVYVSGTGEAPRRRLLWVDRGGTALPAIDDPGAYRDPRIAPDGERIALSVQGDIWVADVSRRNLNRLTFSEAASRPIWSPDSSSITFGQTSDDGYNIFELPVGGSQQPIALTEGPSILVPASWSPDHRWLVCRKLGTSESNWDVAVLDAENGNELRVLLDSPYRELHPMLSPNGDAIAYTSEETGTVEVYVQDFPALGNKIKVSNGGGTEPLWTKGGLELVYRSPTHVVAIPVTSDRLSGLRRVGEPEPLFEDVYQRGDLGQTANFDVTPDGERFLMIELLDPGSQEIVVVVDWLRELDRLAPAT